MIKCKIKDGGKVTVSGKGTVREITVETLMLIQQIYQQIKESNPDVAEQYKRNIIGATLAPDSPVWKDYSLDKPEKT